MIYSLHHLEGVLEVEELARAAISESHLVIICRGEPGIYEEVELHLRRLHGKRLGVIILRRPLVFLLAGPHLKQALCPVVPASISSLFLPQCGFDLCHRSSLWNQLGHGLGAFGEPAALPDPALVLPVNDRGDIVVLETSPK